MIVFSHPTGNQNSRQAALALARHGLLADFRTSISWVEGGLLDRLAPERVRRHMRRRAFPPELQPWLHAHPGRELGRQVARALGLAPLLRPETGALSIDAVYRAQDRHVARRVLPGRSPSGVYAYEDAALETLRAARRLGWHGFYELPIGYWRAAHALLREESEREPEWASTLSGIHDSPAKLARKDEELRLAQTILVPSRFVQETLSLAPEVTAPVFVNPYGAPPPRAEPPATPAGGPLRVLFVGALGQRKGLAYVLRAIERLGRSCELTLLGRRTSETCAPLDEAVRRYRWLPSLPHAEVLAEMGRHDVLVFPSLFEGLALVLLEALSQGLPVIATPNSGAADILTEGVDGYCIPIRSAEALAEKLDGLAADRSLLAAMKTAALETARRRSWAEYGERLVACVSARLPR